MVVKRTRQKGGAIVTVEEFLGLESPKGDLVLKIGREQVSVTSLDRIYWPDEKLTKFDLLSYYLRVADYIMPFLKDRPAILQRYPRGIKAPMFFQQDLASAPEFIKTAKLINQEGRELDYGVYSTLGSVVHFVTLGTIEQHPWHSTTKHLDKPDWIAIDLDPKRAPWENVLQVALMVKEVADEIGLEVFPEDLRIVRHAYLHAAEAGERVRQSGGVCADVCDGSCAACTEDRDGREGDCEAQDHAGLC